MKRITLRLPDELHARVEGCAEAEHRSLNSMLLALIAAGLSGPIPEEALARVNRNSDLSAVLTERFGPTKGDT